MNLVANADLAWKRVPRREPHRAAPPGGREPPAAGAKPSHSGGWNYGFADGDAKWHKPEQAVATPGRTYTTAFVNASGFNCYGTELRPCGMWTIAVND